MPSLKELSEDFTSPPENIVNLPNLEEWGHMDEQRLRLAVKIPSLKRLHISSNIKTIPSELGDLHNLQELSIWSENLQTIPEIIGALKSLKNSILSDISKRVCLRASACLMLWKS